MVDFILRGGTIIDGSGRNCFSGDIVIDSGIILHVGESSRFQSEHIRNLQGKVVTPGFIDIHSHSDFPIYVDGLGQSGIRQGITTSVIGNCGHGPAPAPDKEMAKQVTIGVNDDWGIDFNWTTFDEYLSELLSVGQSMNVAPLVAHGAIRVAAMGYEPRLPSKTELENMGSMVDAAMSAGALGLSTGLEYSPGRHADTDELIYLSKIVGRFGGIYASHIRERGDDFEGAVNEALNIGLKGDVQVQLSHLAPRPYAPANILDKILANILKATLDGQSVGIDTFPDPWGPAHLLDLVPSWVYEGSEDEVLTRLKDPDTAEKCYEYVYNKGNFLLRLSGFDQFYLSYSRSYPEFMSMSLDSISKDWGIDIVQTILKLAAADGKDFGSVLIRHIFSTEDDLDQLLKDPLCSVGSDGAVASKEGLLKELKMNRSSFGYVPRTIEEYSIKRGLFSVEEAVRKMTSLPASQINVRDRGTIEAGKVADVVVIDLETLADLSTDDQPQQYPTGIDTVLVNGEIVFEDGAHTMRRPGKILRI